MATPFTGATLPGLGALGPLEVSALRKRIEELLSEETTRQGGLAQQAGTSRSAYEGLAGAPLPQLEPIESGTQQLFGDMASIISRRSEFGDRTREDVKQRGAMLLQQRIQNIQILRDRYQEDAAKIGKLDPIKALELSEKTERMNKLLEQLHERDLAEFNQGQATLRSREGDVAAMERTREQSRSAAEVANINSQAELMRWLASGGGADKGALTTEKREERKNAFKGLFLKPEQKEVPTKARPMYQQGLITMSPAAGQTAEQWTNEMVREFSAAQGGKPLNQRQVEDIVRARALHFAVDQEPPAGAD